MFFPFLRAWVLNTVRNDAVKVFFLDYGNTSEIDLKYIRSPKESIWKLPPKARAFRIDSRYFNLHNDVNVLSRK